MTVLPQFPLGTVLFPTMILPLHVFEPRYRQLVADIIDGDGRFGVVLIERGSDVGGGEVRTEFGTVAKIVKAEEFTDGRWALITVGQERFKVQSWLDDDPYPRADVELWPDPPVCEASREEYQQVASKFRRCMGLAAEAGFDVGPLPETVDDMSLGCMQMSAMAPVNPLDKQRLLGAADAGTRLRLLDDVLDEAVVLIEARLTES